MYLKSLDLLYMYKHHAIIESHATRHSAVSAFTETVEYLERSLASMLMRYWPLIFSRHNRFAETHSHLQLSYHITDRLLAAGNNKTYTIPYFIILISNRAYFAVHGPSSFVMRIYWSYILNIIGTLTSLDTLTQTLLPEEVYDLEEDTTENIVFEKLLKDYDRQYEIFGYPKLTRGEIREKAEKRFKRIERQKRKQRERTKFVSKYTL